MSENFEILFKKLDEAKSSHDEDYVMVFEENDEINKLRKIVNEIQSTEEFTYYTKA